jgi:hypothetical protein
LTNHDDGLGLGRGGSQLHHDDDGSNCSHGRQRVHDNAQLAMIGVGLVRVQVRYLRYREQGQEDKA